MSIERGLFGVLRKRKQIRHPACVRFTISSRAPIPENPVGKLRDAGDRDADVNRGAKRCKV